MQRENLLRQQEQQVYNVPAAMGFRAMDLPTNRGNDNMVRGREKRNTLFWLGLLVQKLDTSRDVGHQ